MAKLFAEVVIAGNYKRLSRASRGANKEMSNMAKASQKMSSVMKASIAGIGFAQITSQLVQAAKAADEDRRSMALLNNQLTNSWKATDQTKKSVDDFITSMSMMSGIADDDLRPAYAKIATQTKSLTKANKMFALAMDISADRGVSLDVAAKAVAKAMAGNKNAFSRLYPEAIKSGNAIDYVTKKSKGAAKISGNNSPFARLNVQFNEMKETIGRELLPYVDKLAKWMNSKEGQKTVKETTTALVELVKEAGKLAKWAIDNKETIIAIAIALKGWQITSGVINSWKTLAGIWKGMKPPSVAPTGGPVGPKGVPIGKPLGPKLPSAGIGAALPVAGAAAAAVAVYGTSMTQLYNTDRKKFNQTVIDQINRAKKDYGQYFSATEFLTATGLPKSSTSGPSNMMLTPAPERVYITVNTSAVSGDAVVDALKRTARRKGLSLGKMLID